jgi:hypothetical protein
LAPNSAFVQQIQGGIDEARQGVAGQPAAPTASTAKRKISAVVGS